MKNIFIISALIILFAGCSVTKNDKIHHLTILHTNDHHGAILPIDSKGGLAQRATYINSIKATTKNILILDAGDINIGGVISNMFDAVPDIKAYNAMGYDAVTLGNHEFDGGHQKLLNQIKESKFKWLSANILDQNLTPIVNPYIIKDYDGFRVGILGLTTTYTKNSSLADPSLVFEDEIQSAKKYVKILKDTHKVDIIIALTHLGTIKESATYLTAIDLAKAVDQIDLIIDGHSHTKFQNPLYVGKTAIVSAYERGKFVGKAKIAISNNKRLDLKWSDHAITQDLAPDPVVSQILAPYIQKANASLKDIIFQTSDEFELRAKETRYQETAIGNFICDSIVSYLKERNISVDFAMINGGSIRSGLPKGDITKEDILLTLPHQDSINVIKISGKTLIKLFERVASLKQGNGEFMQVSSSLNYTVAYDKSQKGKLVSLSINSSPVDPNRLYYLATNSYIATNQIFIDILGQLERYDTAMPLSQSIMNYALTLKTKVAPKLDGRIKIIKQ
jgi:5'-nucleotidase/UDP-sugar diphosphatase